MKNLSVLDCCYNYCCWWRCYYESYLHFLVVVVVVVDKINLKIEREREKEKYKYDLVQNAK